MEGLCESEIRVRFSDSNYKVFSVQVVDESQSLGIIVHKIDIKVTHDETWLIPNNGVY